MKKKIQKRSGRQKTAEQNEGVGSQSKDHAANACGTDRPFLTTFPVSFSSVLLAAAGIVGAVNLRSGSRHKRKELGRGRRCREGPQNCLFRPGWLDLIGQMHYIIEPCQQSTLSQ